MNILVTGGAGYIGSHTLIELLNSNHNVVVIDNLSNSNQESLRRVEKITETTIPFHKFDVRDTNALEQVFNNNSFDAVIHFAGLKAVGQSVLRPLEYYSNNIDSTLVLLATMKKYNVKKLVFSSSATVYGTPEELPLKETSRVGIGITNPYGQTKLMIEQILGDIVNTHTSWSITSLRYFNPIGAHESGMIGEDPNGTPNNLLPYISQVAAKQLDKLKIFGNDYATIDGTGVRDYIHVIDLARAHLAAIEHLDHPDVYKAYNIGTGEGTSVLQLLKAFERAYGKTIPYTMVARRPGDIASCYADPSKALSELQWRAEKTINDACRDSWNWQSNNPKGYTTSNNT